MKHIFIAIILMVSLSSTFAKDEVAFEQLIQALATTEMQPLVLQTELKAQPEFPKFITSQQATILSLAERVGRMDGHKDPLLLMGILMQETHAGANPRYLRSPGGNHGIGQIRVVAARHVLRDYPELMAEFKVSPKDEKDLVKKLVHDIRFNISVMSKYLLILRKAGFSTTKQLALAYNQGAGGAKKQNAETFPYVTGVMKYVKDFQRFN